MEVAAVKTVDVRVDIGQVGRVIGMEISDLLSLDLLDLIVRHEVSALDTLKWVKFALLLDHELVNLMHENKTIVAGRNKEPLIVR